MIKHNRLISLSVFLMLIFAMPGMPDLVTKIYAASSVSELFGKYLDEPFLLPFSDTDLLPDTTTSSSPRSRGSVHPFSDADLLPDTTTSSSPQSRQYSPTASLTDPTVECVDSNIVGVRASGYDGSNVPKNTLDKSLNTRWSDYGIGKWIQYELDPKKVVCAIDIAWHRGDERTFNFVVSVSSDGTNFVNVLTSKSSGDTRNLEHYPVSGSELPAKYVRITVNGNTENRWASITEVRILSAQPSSSNTLVYKTTSSESRTILPIQMRLPDGTWSQPVKYNFDTGASWPTDVAPEFLAAFGYGPDGVGTDSSLRKAQPGQIKIVGLDKVIDLPVMVQDKDHYDLFREQPPPIRYPLLNVKDILTQVSLVFDSEQTVLRLKGVPIPELADTSNLITLPDFQPREGTPTKGWQWMRVNFINPSTGADIEDWFGLNTGDYKIVLKKQSVADEIDLPLTRTDDCNYASKGTLDFIEASKPVKLDSATVQVRDEEDCQFARGGEPRNFGGGVQFLSKYKMIVWDLHRALLPR
jgi:hypothetical protein